MSWWLSHVPTLIATPASLRVALHRLRVELGVPLAELQDRPVAVRERRDPEEHLVLPDRRVLADLLVDLRDERVGDGGRQLLVLELADDEVEAHLGGRV